MQLTIGDWTVDVTLGAAPLASDALRANARCVDEVGLAGPGPVWFVALRRSGREWPDLVVVQRFDPGPDAGFEPGALLVSDTATLFLGAGTRVMAYDLAEPRRLWLDEADTGFWWWQRHGDVVLMSAELELAAWTTDGKKLWSMFVEPPWTYDVDGTEVRLDVMGQLSRFSLSQGPGR